VGDRYVLEHMLGGGLNLGGEQSGHILLLDRSVAGDGIITTIELIHALQAGGCRLSEMVKPMKKFPQVLLNVSVLRKPDLEKVPAIRDAIGAVASELGNRGRVVVRYSGTEALARVMVEGPQEEVIRNWAQRIAQVIQHEIG